jgi:hypothetical protein
MGYLPQQAGIFVLSQREGSKCNKYSTVKESNCAPSSVKLPANEPFLVCLSSIMVGIGQTGENQLSKRHYIIEV